MSDTTEQRPDPRQRDSRESPRTRLSVSVRVEMSGTHIAGNTRDVSERGVMLVTDEPIPVTVEYLDGDQPVSRRGRVVRVQRLAGEALGIAIAFEGDADADE
ncbi:MAG: PilZ domain-containing protein [Planctomycetota bacterium]